MKFSLALYISIASAKTVFVTQTQLTTIYNGGSPNTVEQASAQTVEASAPAPAASVVAVAKGAEKQPSVAAQDFTPSTLSTASTASTSKTNTASTASSAPQASASGSDSDLYAEIDNSPGVDKDFAKSILDAHNKDRALHSAQPLAWDSTVFQYAQDYADKYDCSGQLTHSKGKYGENLAVGYATGVKALDAWYDEGKSYDYSSNEYNHFTQVVWKGTTKVGCAYKDCSSQNWGKYVICSYDPAGNVQGQFKENVLSN